MGKLQKLPLQPNQCKSYSRSFPDFKKLPSSRANLGPYGVSFFSLKSSSLNHSVSFQEFKILILANFLSMNFGMGQMSQHPNTL